MTSGEITFTKLRSFSLKIAPLGTVRLSRALLCALVSSAIAAAEPLPVAYPIGEPALPAQLSGIDQEWNFSFKAGGKVRVIAAADLAYWGRYRDADAGPQVVLSDGGIVRADVLLMDEKQMVLGDATGLARGMWDESSVPREAVKAIVLQPPAARADRDRLFRELRGYMGSEDRLLLVGGESIQGALVAAPRLGRFAGDQAGGQRETYQLARRTAKDPLVVPAANIVAVSFGAGPAQRKRPRTGTWLGTNDGSLVYATALRAKGNVLSIELASGGELKTSVTGRDDPDKRFWDSVTYAEPATSRVQWLSDQSSAAFKQIPFLSVERPLGIDESPLGTRLRAGQAVFRKGIGMPSASRVAYDVARYRQFQAELAIDEVAGLLGSVVFKVLLDKSLGDGGAGQWRIAYQSPVVRGGDAPLPITIDLKGAARMALIVEFADRGDEGDFADWLQARLAK